jgi:hypothetical protein
VPQAQNTNIAGVNGLGFSTGPQVQDVLNGSTAVPFGTLVALATPITTNVTTTFVVNAATTVNTTAPLNIGISIGGGVGGSMAANATGQVVIHGHVRALYDNTSVVGNRNIIGTTAGSLHDAGTTTGTLGLNYGVALEAVTVGGTSLLVNIWFEKT